MDVFENDEGAIHRFDAMVLNSTKVTSVTGVFGIHLSEKEPIFFPILRCPGLVLPELSKADEGDDMEYMWSVAMGAWTGDVLLDVDWGEGKEIRLHIPLDSTVRRALETIIEAGGKLGISSHSHTGGEIDDTIMMEIDLEDEAFQMCARAARLIEAKKKEESAA